MGLLDKLNAARESERAGEEETLAKGTPPLPYTPNIPAASGPAAAPVQSIPEPEGVLETVHRGFFDPGWLLERAGAVNNPFSLVKEGAEVTAEAIDEAVTNRRKERELADQGVDVRHGGLTDAQGDAVRSMQAQTANILSMHELEPEFVSNTLNGILSAKFNKVEEDMGSDVRYAPSQFQVALDTKTGRLLFTHPVTQQRTPIDSYAVTSEDFTHVMEQMKPLLWEMGLGVAGTVVGGLGAGLATRNPTAAARAATVTGGLAEIFGAVFAKYDQRASALRMAGYRPVRWNMEENREDAAAPLRWMFYNAGRGLDGRNEPFPDPGEKSWTDANVFLEGAGTAAAFALGGQVAMKGLYGLYRLSKRGAAGKELSDIASARDFEKALRQRDIEVGEGEVLKQSLNTPQVMANYADHLALQASEEATKGNFRRARKLRDEASYYRRIGDDYNNKLSDLGVGGTGQAQANIDQAGVEEIRKVTGVDPELRIPGSATGEVVDEQLIDVGRRVINTVAESDAQKVATNLDTMRGASDNLRQQLIEQGRLMRGGPEVSGAGTTLDVFPSQSPSIKLQQAFDDTKEFLVGGDKSWWSTKVSKPANQAVQDLVGGRNITIRAPDTLRLTRARVLRQGISSRVDEFTKHVARTVNLPEPKMVGGNVQFGGPNVEVTTNLKDVSSMIRELRVLKGEVANSANDMRVANELEGTLLDLRKRLVQGSPKYLGGTNVEKAAIRKALRGLDEADALYNETMGLYSRGRIGAAMQIANRQPVGPTDQRSTTFFQTLIPPNSSAEDVGMLLNSLNRSDIGLRAADDVSAEQLLRSGLYQTYLNKVVGEENIVDAIARRGTGKEALRRVFNIDKHREFMSEYGHALRALTPSQGNRSADEVFQELNDRPEALYKIVRDNLDARKKLETALNESSSLKALGIDPTRPDIAVSDVLTRAPENYGALRKLVGGLEVEDTVKETLLKDMDESVKSMFVRMITTRTPGRGVSIDPTLLQEALQRVRAGGEEAFRFRSALEVVYSKGELEQMGKIAQGLEVLNQSARTGTSLPDLKGTLLDNRKAFGAIARWYVGVLNTRARALTSVQRVAGRKTEQALLKALTDPKEAQKLLKGTIPKAGLLGRSILNLVGATTGVYYSQEEAEEIAEFSKLKPGDISRERLGGPMPDVDRDKTTSYRDLRTPMKIPEFNIPAAESLAKLPVVGQYAAPYVAGQTPATLTVPPVVQQGLGKLQQKGVDWLRDVEQRKLAGIPAPMNKGGIVNARPRRQIVL
jgi:hypothetical protein